jgi:hypothetical protein
MPVREVVYKGRAIYLIYSAGNVPDNVKKYPEKTRRQWAHVWNSSYRRCKAKGGSDKACESVAFRNANGVLKRQGKNMEHQDEMCPCNELTDIDEFSEENLAKMPTGSRNALPNAAFAVVEPCWQQNKAARHLPHHTRSVKSASENSSIDKPHLRNALARMNQIKSACGGSDAAIRSRAKSHLTRHARAVLPGSKFNQVKDDPEKLIEAIDEQFATLEKIDLQRTARGWKMTLSD